MLNIGDNVRIKRTFKRYSWYSGYNFIIKGFTKSKCRLDGATKYVILNDGNKIHPSFIEKI